MAYRTHDEEFDHVLQLLQDVEDVAMMHIDLEKPSDEVYNKIQVIREAIKEWKEQYDPANYDSVNSND